MPAVQPFNGPLHELRERWRAIVPGDARIIAVDPDGTLHLAVLGRVSGRYRSQVELWGRRAIRAIDGVAIKRVRCRRVPIGEWETL